MGTYAGYKNTTGDGNSFMGYQAGQANTTGGNNSFVGYRVGYLNTTGSRNSFLGYQAGQANTTGNYNSFLGFRTGYLNTTGSNNVFLGSYAGHLNTTGIQNSFVGNQAGYSNTTGSQNSFLGTYAGYYNQTGSANAIFGNFAGGYDAEGVNSFSSSTIMGYQAGYGLTTGSDNILLGFQAGNSITTGHDNIIIGYDEDAPTATTNNHLNIGGIIYGDLSTGNVGIGTMNPDQKLTVSGNISQTGIIISSGTEDNYFAGNVGIGTTVPEGILHIAQAPGAAGSNFYIDNYSTTPAAKPTTMYRRSHNGTLGVKTVTESGDHLGMFSFQGVNSSSAFGYGAVILAEQDGAAGVTYIPTSLKFYTFSGSATNNPQLVLASTGKVGIGTTSPGSKLEIQIGEDLQDGITISDPDTTVAFLGDRNSTADNGMLKLWDEAGTARVEINAHPTAASYINAGNVGIGTTNPKQALEVSGLVRVGRYATASLPTCDADALGSFAFDTTEDKPYVCAAYDGGTWKPLDSDYDKDGIVDWNDQDDTDANLKTANLIPKNIKEGVEIFGVTGTLVEVFTIMD